MGVLLLATTLLCGPMLAGAYSTQRSIDMTGELVSPNFYCVNNCLCDHYVLAQDLNNASLATLVPRGSGLCQCPGQPFFVRLPDHLPNSTESLPVPCSFQRHFPRDGCTCALYRPAHQVWPFVALHAHCSDGGANTCYGWWHRPHGHGVDDDDGVAMGSTPSLRASAHAATVPAPAPFRGSSTLPGASGPASSPPSSPAPSSSSFVVWEAFGAALRDPSVLVGRDVAAGSPSRSVANKSLVDAPQAVAVVDPTGDTVYYTDKGGRVLALAVTEMVARVVLDLRLPDAVVIDSLAADTATTPALWFTVNRTLQRLELSGASPQPVVVYTCPLNCSNAVVSEARNAVFFAVDSATPGFASIVSLPLTATADVAPTTVVSGVQRAKYTIVPLAVDHTNGRLFFADLVFGIQVVPLPDSGGDAGVAAAAAVAADGTVWLTVAEPDGPTQHMVVHPSGGNLTWLTFSGKFTTLAVPPPSAASTLSAMHAAAVARRRLRLASGTKPQAGTPQRLGQMLPPPSYSFALFHGDVVAGRNNAIVFGADPTNRTVLYSTWYRDFAAANPLQFVADKCVATALHVGPQQNSFLYKEPIPAHGPAVQAWNVTRVWSNVPVTSVVVMGDNTYRAQSLATNDNGVTQVSATGQVQRVLCTDAGRGVSGDLYVVDTVKRPGDVYYAYDPASDTVFVGGTNVDNNAFIGRMGSDGSGFHEVWVTRHGPPVSLVVANEYLFWVDVASQTAQVVTAELDGTHNASVLALGTGRSSSWRPTLSVSPDGKSAMLLTSALSLSCRNLVAFNTDGSGLQQLTAVPFMWAGGMFATPNGSVVYFVDSSYGAGPRIGRFTRAAADPQGFLTPFDNVVSVVRPSRAAVLGFHVDFGAHRLVWTLQTSLSRDGLQFWTADLDGNNQTLVAAKAPATLSCGSRLAVTPDATAAVCFSNTASEPWEHEGSYVLYTFATNTTTAVTAALPQDVQPGAAAVSSDGKHLWYAVTQVRSSRGYNVFFSQLWYCSLASCTDDAVMVVNATASAVVQEVVVVEPPPSSSQVPTPSAAVYILAGGDVTHVDVASASATYSTFSVQSAATGRVRSLGLRHIAVLAATNELVWSDASADGSSHYTIAVSDVPAQGGNATTVKAKLLTSFTALGMAMDWHAGLAYIQPSQEFQSELAGVLMVYNVSSGTKSWLNATSPTVNIARSGGQSPLQWAPSPVDRLYYHEGDGALVSFTNSGDDATILLETVHATPKPLLADVPFGAVAWHDTTDNGTSVLRYCYTNGTGNGTASQLLTSPAAVPPGFVAMAVHGGEAYTAFVNGSVLATDFLSGATREVARSDMLLNATTMAVDATTDTLYVGTRAGDILSVATDASAAPVVFQSGVDAGVYKVWLTPSLEHCF